MTGDARELNTVLMRATFRLEGSGSLGTAFILGRLTGRREGEAFFVLVTAAHVLEQINASAATLSLRKKASGLYQKVHHRLEIRRGGRPLWTRHPDALVDVAAMYVALPDDADIVLLPAEMLATDETLNRFEIHPGDEFLCLGYPFGAEANEAGFPVLRSGKVASYPLLPTKETRTFLYDFQVFRGNSGGPVYFVESGRTYAGGMHVGTIQFIAGIVVQEFTVTEKTQGIYEARETTHPLGLARVVHASLVKETVDMLPPPD